MKHLTLPEPAPRHWRHLRQRKGLSLTRLCRRFVRWVDGLRAADAGKSDYSGVLK